MYEEIIDSFNARYVLPEEGGYKRHCNFFVTEKRLVVNIPEGMNPWISLVTVTFFLGSLVVGVLSRSVDLLTIGFGIGIIVLILLVSVDFIIRQRKNSRIKRLVPEEILKAGKNNFGIPYADIVKVKHEEVERFEPPSKHIFVPTPPEKDHIIEFQTKNAKHLFLIDRGDIEPFIDLMNRFIPDKIEEHGTEG